MAVFLFHVCESAREKKASFAVINVSPRKKVYHFLFAPDIRCTRKTTFFFFFFPRGGDGDRFSGVGNLSAEAVRNGFIASVWGIANLTVWILLFWQLQKIYIFQNCWKMKFWENSENYKVRGHFFTAEMDNGNPRERIKLESKRSNSCEK